MSHHNPTDDPRPLRYGSLFSGIEGIGLACERAGMVPAFQVAFAVTQVPQAIAYTVTPEGGQGADLVVKETEISQTLTAVALGRSSDRQPLVLHPGVEFVVRRLLPVECLRLQGFPDDWVGEHTEDWRRPDGLSDSAAYQAAGNSVAVPVFHWVAQRIVEAHERLGLRELPPPAPQPFDMPEFVTPDADAAPVVDDEPAQSALF